VLLRRSNIRPLDRLIPLRERPRMFAVEVYATVRHFVFIDGNSRREAARVFGLSRETVSKMCRYGW
jgi:DNA-binding transcriptional regulator LsrR (DeoR family)